MKLIDSLIYKLIKNAWDNKSQYEVEVPMNKMATAIGIDRGLAEGEDRISFELTSAVGGRILNVRRYDQRKDRHEGQTYVIASGEDVGERVAKILNLELLK